MTQSEIDNHLEISERFLHQAEHEFESVDRLQASEKAWGAAAHYLKSIAKYRGWPNESHRDLNDTAFDLAHETDSFDRVNNLYKSAGQLHVNFYEDNLTYRLVANFINGAGELIHRLESRTRPPTESGPSRARRQR